MKNQPSAPIPSGLVVLSGFLDVCRRVVHLLAEHGIRTELRPLPFSSPQVVEGQPPGGRQCAEVCVRPQDRDLVLEILERNREAIENWFGRV